MWESCEQDARGHGHIRMNVFPGIGKHFSIGKSNWFLDITNAFMDLLISEVIYLYWRLLSDIIIIISLNSEILDKYPFDVPGPLYWHGLPLIPAPRSFAQPFGCISKKISKLRVTGLCEGNHRWPVDSPHKGPVTRKMFTFDDVIILWIDNTTGELWVYFEFSGEKCPPH